MIKNCPLDVKFLYNFQRAIFTYNESKKDTAVQLYNDAFYKILHPADQLVLIMERIYSYQMTTTSGGNLSILDDNGDIWITPAGVDKGSLTRDDMVRVTPSGESSFKRMAVSQYFIQKTT